MTTEAITKITTRTGNAHRSNACTRLCPKNATASCTSTMTSRQSLVFQPSSALSANAPLTLLTANQPTPATRELIPAGRILPSLPKLIRDSTICGTPNNGPRSARAAIDSEPSAVPSTIASAVSQKFRPKNQTPMNPTKTVANSMFGDTQVQNCCSGLPCRSASGMYSAPPGSIFATFAPYVPSRTSASITAVLPALVVWVTCRTPLSSMWPAERLRGQPKGSWLSHDQAGAPVLQRPEPAMAPGPRRDRLAAQFDALLFP